MSISKRTPKNETAVTHESNKRRLKRLLRQMVWNELSAPGRSDIGTPQIIK